MKYLKKWFALALAPLMALCMGLAGCKETPLQPSEPEKIEYTVTVEAEGGEIPASVKVRILKEDGTLADEKTPAEGKAVFLLEKGDYTATLSGAGEEYRFEEGTLTAAHPACTLRLEKRAEETFSWTVLLKLPDGSAAAQVEIQIWNSRNEVKVQTTDTEGKARFSLTEGTYSVRIDPAKCPEGTSFDNEKYTFEAKEEGQCEVLLDGAKQSYSFTFLYRDTTDVFLRTIKGGVAEGVKVALYAGELPDDTPKYTDGLEPAATVTSDGDGKAFVSLPAGVYTLVLMECRAGYKFEYPRGKRVVTVDAQEPDRTYYLKSDVLGASNKTPVVWTLGENEMPFSQQSLQSEYSNRAICSFTPETSGTYTFTTSSASAVILAPSGFEPLIDGEGSASLELEGGTTYLFECDSSRPTDGSYAFTVTIALAN